MARDEGMRRRARQISDGWIDGWIDGSRAWATRMTEDLMTDARS